MTLTVSRLRYRKVHIRISHRTVTAISKANREVSGHEQATPEEINEIISFIEDQKKTRILVEDIQDIIEQKLMEMNVL